MFDSLFEHLTPSMFLIALAGHVIAEGSAKFTVGTLRRLGYLAAIAMLPMLLHLVDQRRSTVTVDGNHRKNMRLPRSPKKRKSALPRTANRAFDELPNT